MVSILQNSFGLFTPIFIVRRLSRHNRIDKHRQKVRWARSRISLANGVTCTAAEHCLAFGILNGVRRLVAGVSESAFPATAGDLAWDGRQLLQPHKHGCH